MLSLRPYQQRAYEESRQAFAAGATGVLNVLPTGSGKGDCITHWILECVRWQAPVAMAVHLREIALDVVGRLLREAPGLPIRTMLGCDEGPSDARVTIGSWQTFESRAVELGARLFIADEAHRTKTATALSVLERQRSARLLGFTATGQRGDGSGLGPAGYQRLITGPQIVELVEAGHLAPVHHEAPDEYVDELADDPARAIYERHQPGDAWIVYGSSIAHSYAIAAECRRRGLRANHVDSDVGAEARASSLARLASGELDVLTNFRLFVEGVNVKRCSGIVLASAFSHDGPYLQAIGRGRRYLPGKVCRIVDLRGNIHRRGHPDEDRTYHLDGTACRRAGAAPPVVCCKSCLAWFAPRPACPVCGARAPAPKPPRISKRELKEMRQERAPRTGPGWERWCQLVWEARRRGRDGRWAPLAYEREFGRFPIWGARQVPDEPAATVAQGAA